MGEDQTRMASAEADLEANTVAAPKKKNIEQVENEIDPDEDPTGICCGVFDPPTGFEKREVVRISNRKADEIKAEIFLTLKKFGAFIVWFYVVLYIFCLGMQAAMGVTIKGNAPFDSARFDWDGDEGIAVGVGMILGHRRHPCCFPFSHHVHRRSRVPDRRFVVGDPVRGVYDTVASRLVHLHQVLAYGWAGEVSDQSGPNERERTRQSMIFLLTGSSEQYRESTTYSCSILQRNRMMHRMFLRLNDQQDRNDQ